MEEKMSTGVSSSMLKKLTGFLIRRKDKKITPAEAEKIQKAAYTLSHTEVKKKYSPVYLSLVSGLDSEEKQVFEATAYYMARIARNKIKYRDDILRIFNKKISEKDISPEFRDFIKNLVCSFDGKNNQ